MVNQLTSTKNNQQNVKDQNETNKMRKEMEVSFFLNLAQTQRNRRKTSIK